MGLLLTAPKLIQPNVSSRARGRRRRPFYTEDFKHQYLNKEKHSSGKVSFSKYKSFGDSSEKKKKILFLKKVGRFILMNSNNQIISLITLLPSIWNNLHSRVGNAINYAWTVCLLHSKLQGKLFLLKGLVSLKCTKWQKAKGSWCLSNQDWGGGGPGAFQSQPTEVNVIGVFVLWNCRFHAWGVWQ